jgi:hypothetical protein
MVTMTMTGLVMVTVTMTGMVFGSCPATAKEPG